MKKIIFNIFLISVSNLLNSHYNYGLELCDLDAKISGKLNITVDTNSIFIGENAGISIERVQANENTFIGFKSGEKTTSGITNTFVGFESGKNNTNGRYNTFLGAESGQENATIGQGNGNTFVGVAAGKFNRNNANWNTFIGLNAGFEHYSGGDNTFIGSDAGLGNNNGDRHVFLGGSSGSNCLDGSDNIFIGYNSGLNHQGDNMLVIENSSSDLPLIYGEFNNDKVLINGSFHIRDALQLLPQTPPSGVCSDNGELKYGTDNELYLCKGGTWKQVITN